MVVFVLGLKQIEECYLILVELLEKDLDYGVCVDVVGVLGYLGDVRVFKFLV